jgi:hypothetical protein
MLSLFLTNEQDHQTLQWRPAPFRWLAFAVPGAFADTTSWAPARIIPATQQNAS